MGSSIYDLDDFIRFLAANGWRYPLGVGGWTRRRNGKNSKPEKRPKNAVHTPSRVQALSGCRSHLLKRTRGEPHKPLLIEYENPRRKVPAAIFSRLLAMQYCPRRYYIKVGRLSI